MQINAAAKITITSATNPERDEVTTLGALIQKLGMRNPLVPKTVDDLKDDGQATLVDGDDTLTLTTTDPIFI